MKPADAGSVLVAISALLALGFITDYWISTRGGWRKDPIGRHLMAYVLVDAIVLVLGTIRAVGGASLSTGWFAWTRAVVFLGIPWMIGWRWLILRRLYPRRRWKETIVSFWSQVEAKTKAAGLYGLAATIVVAACDALLNGSVIPASPHAWAEFAITVAIPPIAAFVGSHRAPHTSIPPVPTAKPPVGSA